MSKPKALTLVEVLVSMLIFALIMAGMSNLFIATKRQTISSRAYMVAGELGRYFLERLHLHVRQDTWNNNPAANPPPDNPPPDGPGNGNFLSPVNDPNSNYRTPNLPVDADGFPQFDDTHGYTAMTWIEKDSEIRNESPELDAIRYYPVYEIQDIDDDYVTGTVGPMTLRKVKLTICWIEPAG